MLERFTGHKRLSFVEILGGIDLGARIQRGGIFSNCDDAIARGRRHIHVSFLCLCEDAADVSLGDCLDSELNDSVVHRDCYGTVSRDGDIDGHVNDLALGWKSRKEKHG